MIKKVLFASFLGFIFCSTFAQTNPRNPIVTGGKAGLNLSNLSAGNNSQYIKPSFHLGGFIEFPLTYYKQFALQVELMYSNQGYIGKEYQFYNDVSGQLEEEHKLDNVNLHYLNVPIVFKYYIQDNFSLEFGPQIGFLMDASGMYDIFRYSTSNVYFDTSSNSLESFLFENGYRSKDYKKYYDTVDYGLNFGLSYNFDNGIFITGRYYLGLKDVYKADNGYTKIPVFDGLPPEMIDEINRINKELDFTAAKNSVFQLSVGYRF